MNWHGLEADATDSELARPVVGRRRLLAGGQPSHGGAGDSRLSRTAGIPGPPSEDRN